MRFYLKIVTLLLFSLASSAWADESSFEVGPGLTGHWYSPDRSGEGLVLEVLDENQALLYWFTYDNEGNPRWLIDVGEIAGSDITFSSLQVSSGGTFGEDFDPDQVQYQEVGSAVLSFSSCDQATFSYSAFSVDGSHEMTRLSETMAAECGAPNGTPGKPIKAYAGESGSWYDPSHSGEGFTFQWLSKNEALVVWFTYDPSGQQFWLIGTGALNDGQIVFETLNAGQGGRFGPDYDPGTVEFSDWGQLQFEIDCTTGIARYQSNVNGFGEGALSIERLTQIQDVACPYEAPKLEDLYEISAVEVPIIDPPDGSNVEATMVALDGTVVASEFASDGRFARRWLPGTEGLERIEGRQIGGSVLVSADGGKVITSQPPLVESGADLSGPMEWSPDSGWQNLGRLIFDESLALAISPSADHIVGSGSDAGGAEHPWAWSLDGGQKELPLTSEITNARPTAVSEDAEVVIGQQTIFASGGPSERRSLGVRWNSVRDLTYLTDSLGYILGYPATCDNSCEIVAGAGQGFYSPDHPNPGQAWVWLGRGNAQYFGTLPDALEDSGTPPYLPTDISADGSIVIGRYNVPFQSNQIALRPFLWTQRTGMVSLVPILMELGVFDSRYKEIGAVSISPDGGLILVRLGLPTSEDLPTNRVFVLELSQADS